MSAEAIVIDMRRAVRTQQWEDALALAEIARRRELVLDEAIEINAGEATALRRLGRLPDAREAYLRLDGLLEREDPRRAEVMLGLAECYLISGVGEISSELAAGAVARSEIGSGRWARAARIQIQAVGLTDLQLAEALSGALLAEAPAGGSRAPLALARSEVMLRQGRLDEASQALLVARSDASVSNATRTLAEVVRREATLAIARADTDSFFPLLGQLQAVERAYGQTGDRGEHQIAIVRASILTHLGRLSTAVTELRRAYWHAHERHDATSAAHALLALADAQRVGGGNGEVAREHAASIYERMSHPWGMFWSAVLIDDPLLAQEDAESIRITHVRALGAMEGNVNVAALPNRPLPLVFP